MHKADLKSNIVIENEDTSCIGLIEITIQTSSPCVENDLIDSEIEVTSIGRIDF